MKCLAGVELGGTTCVVAISDVKNPLAILHREEYKTEQPKVTLNRLVSCLQEFLVKYDLQSYAAIGIASFGPIDLCTDSDTYGFILKTPKLSWQNVDVLGTFKKSFSGVPINIDTDVNAPAALEASISECNTAVYVTVGTGVGIGVYINGAPAHGLLHPEAGHMTCFAKSDDDYSGCCPFHGNCIEGMLCSTALAERAGIHPSQLHSLLDVHPVWEIAGFYLGQLCVNLLYTVSPDFIVLGGGVMARAVLFDICRKNFKTLNGGYVDVGELLTNDGLKNYIRPSTFGGDAGIVGALMLAKFAK
ncbi:putative fructokinase [Xenia sp. Carnegie-2017]|uniref:putative fructokinase n=1 Tax=Xenia sp. Carnegie-2017 TaxID=2897299 RepID=UPI001F03F69A|nr:putative fructokinase [Xenia sp. Carnegie-2017]